MYSLYPENTTQEEIKQLVLKCLKVYESDKLENAHDEYRYIYTTFNNLAIDSIIFDDFGRKFWKQFYFQYSIIEEVETFFDCLAKELNITINVDKMRKCVNYLLTHGNFDKVSILEFSRTLCWFGPIEGSTELDNLFTRGYNQLAKSSFVGIMEHEEGVRLLEYAPKKKSGLFILRFSNTVPTCFTFCYLSKKKNCFQVTAIRIEKKGPNFLFPHKGKEIVTTEIEEIIKLFVKKPHSMENKRFEHLYDKEEKTTYLHLKSYDCEVIKPKLETKKENNDINSYGT